MRSIVSIVAVAALCVACGSGMKNNSAVTWRMDSVSAVHLSDLYQSIADTSVVGEVDVKYPLFEDGPVADSLNAGILRTIAGAFCYNGPMPKTVSAVVDTVVRTLTTDLSGRGPGYYLVTSGQVVRYGGVISVRLAISTYMGGAHGMDQVFMLNYDAANGKRLTLEEMFSDLPRLTLLNRQAFLRHLEALDENPDSVCLFIPADSLPLPKNVLVDSTGVQMHYNPYEIACYAFGSTDYLLPMSEAENLLDEIYK